MASNIPELEIPQGLADLACGDSISAPIDDLDENQKRWLVIGIGLQSIVAPVLRETVAPALQHLYDTLVKSCHIDIQLYPNYVKKHPATNTNELNYQAINNNKTIKGPSKNNSSYDYKVHDPVELSKLFLATNMALYTGFDESCDTSALLGILEKIDVFGPAIRLAAEQTRISVRNSWARCNFQEWDETKYEDCFKMLKDLILSLKLLKNRETETTENLDNLKTYGFHNIDGKELGANIQKPAAHVIDIASKWRDNFDVKSVLETTDNYITELRGDVKDLPKRVQSLENSSLAVNRVIKGNHKNVGGAAELFGVAAPSQTFGQDRRIDMTTSDAWLPNTADDVKVTEETVEHNFKIFRPYLEQNIRALDLLVYYDYFSLDDRRKLNDALSYNVMTAINLAFSKIEQMTYSDKFLRLLHALEVSEHPKLVLTLKGLFVPENDAHHQSIDLAAEHIYKLLSPAGVIPFLVVKGAISLADGEWIRTIENNQGRSNATRNLMLLLPIRSRNWYMLFMEALIEYDELSELPYLIDPDLAKRINAGRHVSLPLAESLKTRNLVERELEQMNKDDVISSVAVAQADVHHFKKSSDDTLDQHTLNELNKKMKSVGALICYNQQTATVFRAGSKCVVTAAHSVSPFWESRRYQLCCNPNVVISFQNPPEPNENPSPFHMIKSVVYYNTKYDTAVLELTDPDKLPPKLTLYPLDQSNIQVQHVHIIGYGHPSNMKTLDPKCKVVSPKDPSLTTAKQWLQGNKDALIKWVQPGVQLTPEQWNYHSCDQKEKIIFNCYLEKGSSGAPILAFYNPIEPFVVGVVTNGLPYCFWNLTRDGQSLFPPAFRFEMGTRMSAIYDELVLSNTDLINDLFHSH